MFNIVLFEPEIPQNTGNVARTCACTGSSLHLIRPFLFEISDKTLKRAGLDYWDKVNVFYYDNLADFFVKNKGAPVFYIETKAQKLYTEITYPDGAFLMFGKETKGLPDELVLNNLDHAVKIPMRDSIRSLNLSNSVAIVLYEALRQKGFELK
ncbi:MAG: tRNA (cytidine(34)-2'-O)-methyltransferase [Firmicutes bacterium]|nr:tRNA (cytidine(34)-2'-O)-methyltransferase [Bacillota bacterium]